MAEMNHTVYRGPEGETTEWEDLHRKFGNLPELPAKVDDYYAEEKEPESREERMGRLDDEGVEELEDAGFEDRKFLEEWKERRRQELEAVKAKATFGSLTDIVRADFVRDVTDASRKVWVVVFLYLGGHEHSKLLERALQGVAAKHREVKFVRIPAMECIENFRPADAPAVFIYHDGAVVKQYFTLRELGGAHVNASVMEWLLASMGAVSTTLDEDPRVGIASKRRDALPARRSGAGSRRVGSTGSDEEEDDDEDDDEEDGSTRRRGGW